MKTALQRLQYSFAIAAKSKSSDIAFTFPCHRRKFSKRIFYPWSTIILRKNLEIHVHVFAAMLSLYLSARGQTEDIISSADFAISYQLFRYILWKRLHNKHNKVPDCYYFSKLTSLSVWCSALILYSRSGKSPGQISMDERMDGLTYKMRFIFPP